MAAISYVVDPVHTFLGFAVRYLAISKVHGRFTRFDGVLEIDWDDLLRSRAHLRIETDSIDTGSPERDAHLRSPDFLDVARFPELIFHGTELVRKSGAVFDVSGRMYLHGIERRITLEAEYGGQASDLNGIERVGILARGALDRREFGLEWNRPLDGGGVLIGHEVELDLAIQGVRTA